MSEHNKTVIVVILVVVIVLFLYEHYEVTKKLASLENKNTNNTTTTEHEIVYSVPTPVIVSPEPESRIIDRNINRIYRDYDIKTLDDPLTPPYKRDDFNINPAILYPSLFSYPTRDYNPVYKKFGYLINESATNSDPFKFLILMGRQKYRGSSAYEYYVVNSQRDSNIKFDLDKYKKEINSDDTIKIEQLNNSEYKAVIDKNLPYDYVPY